MHPYDLLCKVFGSKDVVRMRQKIYTAAETTIQDYYNKVVPSGSRGEGIELKESDFDVMFQCKFTRVYESVSDFASSRNPLPVNVLMDTDDVKLGFTRLIISLDNTQGSIFLFMMTELLGWTETYGTVNYILSEEVRRYGMNQNKSIHGPCQKQQIGSFETEQLICFRCKEWISLAQPWITRPRGHWPSSGVISDIVQFGVLFVPIGCKTSKFEKIEWRISFSIAEKQLILSFTQVQFLCYGMLKTIISDVVKKSHGEALCSYFVKTIMFWVSEEKEPEYWKEENIVVCYLYCLKRLIYCVEHRTCFNYFIPEINFFDDRFSDTEQKNLVRTLLDVYNRGWSAILQTNTFQDFSMEHCWDLFSTSSAVAPYVLIMPLFSMVLKNPRVIPHTLKNISLCKSSFLVQILVLFCYNRTKLSHFDIDSCSKKYCDICKKHSGSYNKILYQHYKSLMPNILISAKTDCVSGWCYLGSMFYNLQMYSKCQQIVKHCLRKCTTDIIRLSYSPYIRIPNEIKTLLLRKRFLQKMLSHYFIADLKFASTAFLPAEVANTFKDLLRKQYIVTIPPTVYILFLDLLCNYHLNKKRAMKKSHSYLQMAIRERHFIVNDYLQKIAEQILHVADELMKKVARNSHKMQ